MGINLERYNRIINLYFFTNNGQVRSITCPHRGRKPSIEINGTFTEKNYLPTINIVVKNLYLDLTDTTYTRIRIEAGYEGNTIPLEGTIQSIYQESPGPEGTTVIQVQNASLGNWLDAEVNLNFEIGTPLATVLEAIKPKLKVTQLKVGEKAATLSIKDTPFMHTGTARDAIAKLEKRFEEYELGIFVRSNMLCAVCKNIDFAKTHTLQYMSAPPQVNTGGKKGTYYTTITAPWMPELDLYDILIIPARAYVMNFQLVAGLISTQKIRVSALSFHFATTGSTNQMTVQGTIV